LNSNKEKWLEILAVVITGLMKFVFMDWLDFRTFYIVAACAFWFLFILRKYKNNPSVLKQWGFKKQNLKPSFLFLLPFGFIAIMGFLFYGIKVNTILFNWHIIPIFLLYPVWGIIQQFVIIGLVAGNLRSLKNNRFAEWQIVLLTSLLFALLHYNSTPLMIYTFVMEVVFVIAYFKWRNLWALGLFHGWVSSFFLFFVQKRDLLNELLIIFQ
jgi:membrane protease YdiL (CAAX protease family)